MLRSIIILLSLSAFLNSYSQDPSLSLRFMTYNIYHGETLNHDFDLNRIADVIAQAQPDFVALQEVDLFTNRAHKMDLTTELAQRLHMLPFFGTAMPFDSGYYGEGILSKHPICFLKNHVLSCSPGNEPRAALEIRIAFPTGDTIAFIGTHFDHTNDPHDRNTQATELIEIIRNIPYPLIVCGDLNAEPGSEAINILEGELSFAFKTNPLKTWPSDKPTQKLDYVMFRPSDGWTLTQKQVTDEQIASDHRPVWVEMLLNKK
ncbi:MAG: endonuclease/exonuclease/phosphatase family protein [Bacteroidales bacterium]|nr:endonuclease/exonuclease/phosphatase family protein [Bacteroidales bacterium]